MIKIKKALLLILFPVLLAACQTTSATINPAKVNVRLSSLSVKGDWKYEGQMKIFSAKLKKGMAINYTKEAITKRFSLMKGPVPLTLKVTIEQMFLPNTFTGIMFTTRQYMTGRVTIIDKRNGKIIKNKMRIYVHSAHPDIFADKVTSEVLKATKNL